jgi:hypothetical protein
VHDIAFFLDSFSAEYYRRFNCYGNEVLVMRV